MKTAVYITLSYFRALLIMLIGMYVLWLLQLNLFGQEKALNYVWLLCLANYLLIFVLYRNKLQFTGWKALQGGSRLSKKTTANLLGLAAVIIGFVVFM